MAGKEGISLPKSRWTEDTDAKIGTASKESLDPVKNPRKLSETVLLKQSRGSVSSINDSNNDPRKKRLQRSNFGSLSTEIHGVTQKETLPQTMVPTPVPKVHVVPVKHSALEKKPSGAEQPTIGKSILDLVKKMVEPVVQPSDTNTNKNAPNAKETPGGNNLNQNLAGRKVDSNVFPKSLVDYTFSQSDDTASETEGKSEINTKTGEEIFAEKAANAERADKSAFARLGDKVKASPKGSMGHLVKQVLDAASSVEEGELSESSLERQNNERNKRSLSTDSSDGISSDEEKETKRSKKKGKKSKKKKSKRSRSSSSDSRSESEEREKKKSKHGKKSKHKKKKHKKKHYSSDDSDAESNLPDKRELMTLIAKIQLKKDSLEKNELSAKKQKKLGKEIKELELKLNEYVKNKETETSNKYEHENKDKDRSLSNDHRSASKDHKNDERKSRDISHDKDKHVRSKDHSSRRKSRSASKGNRRSSRSQDHRRPSDRFDSKQSGKRRSNERKSDDRGSNSKDDLRYELEICKSNRRNNDERLNRSRHARDSRTKSPVFKLVRSPRKSASPRRISSSSKKISASNLVFPDGNSRRNSAGSDSDKERKRSPTKRNLLRGDKTVPNSSLADRLFKKESIKIEQEAKRPKKDHPLTEKVRSKVEKSVKSEDRDRGRSSTYKHEKKKDGNLKSVISFNLEDTDEKGNVSIVEEIVVEEYEEVFESADNSRNDSMSRTLNASVECLDPSAIHLPDEPRDELDIPLPGLNDSIVNTYETSVGAFVDTPLDEDFSNDINKLKESVKKKKKNEELMEKDHAESDSPKYLKDLFNASFQKVESKQKPAVTRKFMLAENGNVIPNAEFEQQETRKVTIKDAEGNSFEEEETRVVKTIQSPVLDSWKAVGEPGLGAWQAGPEPGQHGGYGGAGIKKTSWEEGAEWLAQQDAQKPTLVKTLDLGDDMFRRRESNDRRKEEQRYVDDDNNMYSRRKRGRDSSESDGSDYSDRKHRSSRDRYRHRSRDKYDRYKESSKEHTDKFGRNRDINASDSSHKSSRRSSEKSENSDKNARKRNKSGNYDEIPRRSFEKSTEIGENQRMVWDKKRLEYVKLTELDPEQRQCYEQTPDSSNRRSVDLEGNPKQNDNPANILNKPHDSSVEFIDESPRKLPLPANDVKSRSCSSSRHSQEGEYNNKGYNYENKYSETASQQYNHHSRESSQQDRKSRWDIKSDPYYNKRQSFGGYERNQRGSILGSGPGTYVHRTEVTTTTREFNKDGNVVMERREFTEETQQFQNTDNSFTGNGQNSEPTEPANGHKPEDSQDPAVVAEGSLGLGGVGNIIKLLRVSQSLEENRNSSDRDVDVRRRSDYGGRFDDRSQRNSPNNDRRRSLPYKRNVSNEDRDDDDHKLEILRRKEQGILRLQEQAEENRPKLTENKNDWDHGRGIWDIKTGDYMATENQDIPVSQLNTKLIKKLSTDPEQMAVVKQIRLSNNGKLVGVKIPNVQDLERNYKMDNEDLNTCSGGQGEKQWLYIQDDIRWSNGYDKLTEEMHHFNIEQLRKNESEEITKSFNIPIHQHDILTLTGLRWVNDHCIEFYIQMIAARNNSEEAKKLGFPRIYPMSTYFFTRLQQGYEKVKNWTKKVDIFDYDLIIIPIHLQAIHWSVVIVDFRVPGVFYWDSMKAEGTDLIMCKSFCSQIMNYLKMEHKNKRKKDISLKDYVKDVIDHCPEQENGSDCGMFVCKVVECLSRDVQPTFEQQDLPYFRQRMLWEICNNKLISP